LSDAPVLESVGDGPWQGPCGSAVQGQPGVQRLLTPMADRLEGKWACDVTVLDIAPADDALAPDGPARGHGILPIGGHQTSPLVDTRPPH
jgi:hypothetical protein